MTEKECQSQKGNHMSTVLKYHQYPHLMAHGHFNNALHPSQAHGACPPSNWTPEVVSHFI